MAVQVSAAQLRAWRDAGLTMREAAAKLGCSYSAFWSNARKLEVGGWKRTWKVAGPQKSVAAHENSLRALAIGQQVQKDVARLSLYDYELYVRCRRQSPGLTAGAALAAVRAIAQVQTHA